LLCYTLFTHVEVCCWLFAAHTEYPHLHGYGDFSMKDRQQEILETHNASIRLLRTLLGTTTPGGSTLVRFLGGTWLVLLRLSLLVFSLLFLLLLSCRSPTYFYKQ
jgi:hypothetical protein